MQLKQKPHHLLLLSAIVLSIGGLFCLNTPIDLHLHDTYFVFPLSFLVWVPTMILLVFWVLYLLTMPWLFSQKLTWLHVSGSVIISLLLLALPYLLIYTSHENGNHGTGTFYNAFTRQGVLGSGRTLALVFLTAFLMIQAIYFINLVRGLVSYVARTNKK